MRTLKVQTYSLAKYIHKISFFYLIFRVHINYMESFI